MLNTCAYDTITPTRTCRIFRSFARLGKVSLKNFKPFISCHLNCFSRFFFLTYTTVTIVITRATGSSPLYFQSNSRIRSDLPEKKMAKVPLNETVPKPLIFDKQDLLKSHQSSSSGLYLFIMFLNKA